jgi:hypothetical protein
MDFLSGPIFEKFINDLSVARIVEAYVIFAIVWRKFKPHLTKIEDRLSGLEEAVKAGFNLGEQRFEKIEKRITVLEIKGEQNDQSMGFSGSIGAT